MRCGPASAPEQWSAHCPVPATASRRHRSPVDAPAGYDTAAWSAMAEQGWLALEIPEDEGGLGMGLVETAVLCEEIGRRLAAVPFLPSVVALGALCAPDALAASWTKEWREALSRRGRGRVARVAGAGITAEPSAPTATASEVLLSGGPHRPPMRRQPIWPSSSPTPTCSPSTSARRRTPRPPPGHGPHP